MENDDSVTGSTARQACAACKHQRKKCSENCMFSPFFPAEKNKEFQAVHRFYGVSNVKKILKSLQNYDERKRAVDSLIWEAQCREDDPIHGSFGQYKKVANELRLLKSSSTQQQQRGDLQVTVAGAVGQEMNGNNKPAVFEYYGGQEMNGNNKPAVFEYYGNNGMINGGGTTAVVNYDHIGNNINNFLQSNGAGLILEPIQHSFGSNFVQGQEKRFQRRDGLVCLPNSFNQSQQYF